MDPIRNAGAVPGRSPEDTLPTRPRPGTLPEERRPTSAFVLLRFTLLIATSYMLLADEGFDGLPPLLTAWIGLGLVSNVVVTRLPRRLLESSAFGAGALVFDTLWVTGALLVTGSFEPEFFYLYFFVLFLAAVGESLGLIALGTVVVSSAYLYALSTSGAGFLTESATLIRLPFLFAVASFYGYLVQRVRRERHRARAEAETVRRLEEVRRNLETANRRLEREARVRRRAEDEVRKLSRAVEQSPSIVIITDLHGTVEYANPRFAAVTGYHPREVVGRELRRIAVAEDGAEHPEIAEVLAAGTGWRGEIRYRRTDGEIVWVATSVSPLRSPEGEHTHFIVVQEDVTERKRAEESLEQANRELAKVSELKSAFVSTVSHELRTPLTSIQNAVDIVRSGKPGPLAPDQRRFLDMARRNQERLASIIDDLLDLSKIEAGHLEYRFRELECAPFLAEIRETFEPQAVARGVEIAVEPGSPPPVLADPKRLGQVLTNLVSNALKFTPEGGRVTLSGRAAGPWVELSVTDTGPGIGPEDRRRIFEPFYQASGPGEDSLTRTAKGTGLGLAISRELAWAHGGELGVDDAPGRGARFTVRLPADPARAREAVVFEEEIRRHRKYPFFGLLVLDWPEADGALPGGDGGSLPSALLAARDALREALPRDCDLLRVQPAHRRIVLVLLATPREGSEVVRRRLEERLAGTVIRVDGIEVPPPRILGPAVYPDDGSTGRALIAACTTAPGEELRAETDSMTTEDSERPLGGPSHDPAEDPDRGRRAGRGGDPPVPAHAGRLRGDHGHGRAGGPGRRALGPAGPGADGRDDAAGERLPRVAHATGG